MTAPTLSLTQDQTLTVLRTFLLGLMANGVEVVLAQDNRVPEPAGPDFITMTPILRERLDTNVVTTVDGYPSNPQTRSDKVSERVTIQLDVHGPASADNVQVIATLFRSDWAVDQFAASGFDVAPLYASDPRQIPFTNGEQQVETRWSIDLAMQCNPVTTVSQDFAAQLSIVTVNVDARYPP